MLTTFRGNSQGKKPCNLSNPSALNNTSLPPAIFKEVKKKLQTLEKTILKRNLCLKCFEKCKAHPLQLLQGFGKD